MPNAVSVAATARASNNQEQQPARLCTVVSVSLFHHMWLPLAGPAGDATTTGAAQLWSPPKQEQTRHTIGVNGCSNHVSRIFPSKQILFKFTAVKNFLVSINTTILLILKHLLLFNNQEM